MLGLRRLKESGVSSWSGPEIFSRTVCVSLCSVVVQFLLLVTPAACVDLVFSFEDIEFWVGMGENESAFLIDWNGEGSLDESLVWGYRWTGPTTAGDMLLDILAADQRLYAKINDYQSFGVALYGLGYDLNGDDNFGVSDGTAFNQNGIAVAGPSDGTISVDPEDHYAEGWFDGFWNYGVAAGNPFDGSSWVSPSGGLSSRALFDGSWDSLAFDVDFSFSDFAENPTPAALPARVRCNLNLDFFCDVTDINLLYANPMDAAPRKPAFDLDQSGTIDLGDLDIWLSDAAIAHGRRAPYLPGDANLDEQIDITDFNVLVVNFHPHGTGSMVPDWDRGNFNGDLWIDITDFNLLAANFAPSGYRPTDRLFLTMLPEPSTSLLVSVAVCSLLIFVRV